MRNSAPTAHPDWGSTLGGLSPPRRSNMTPISRRRTSVLCRRDDKLLMIELEDPTTRKRFWSLPGGMIEPGERPESCAIRETFEETGYSIRLTSEGLTTSYLFQWNKNNYSCECHWFLGELDGDHEPALVTDADYLLRAQWIPMARVLMLLSYHPHIQEESRKLLQSGAINSV